MKIISESSKENIITMCGSNQHSHHVASVPLSTEKNKNVKSVTIEELKKVD